MFCRYCGNKLPDDAIFCNRCGERLVPASASTPPPNNVVPPYPSARPTGTIQSSSGNMPAIQSTPSQTNPLPTSQPTPSTWNNAPVTQPISQRVAPSVPTTTPSIGTQNLGSTIAGIGGIIALLAFFFMPYISLGFLGSLTGVQLANYGLQAANSPYITNSSLSNIQALALLWLEPVIAGILIIIAGTQIFRRSTGKGAATGLIIISVLTIAILLILYLVMAQPPQSSSGYTGPTIASFLGSGFWIYILAMIAILIGGSIQARSSL